MSMFKDGLREVWPIDLPLTIHVQSITQGPLGRGNARLFYSVLIGSRGSVANIVRALSSPDAVSVGLEFHIPGVTGVSFSSASSESNLLAAFQPYTSEGEGLTNGEIAAIFFGIILLIVIGGYMVWQRRGAADLVLALKGSPGSHVIANPMFNDVKTTLSEMPNYAVEPPAPAVKDDSLPDNEAFSAAQTPENSHKNYDQKAVPYDATRVALKHLMVGPHTDYYNASFIAGANYEQPYIAAQSPIPSTAEDFWRMVWEQKVETIAMMGDDTLRAESHLPMSERRPAIFKGCTVRQLSVKVSNAGYVMKKLSLTETLTKEKRTIHYIILPAWTDAECVSDVPAFLTFREEVAEWHAKSAGPLMVHCKSGSGGCGVFVIVDLVLKRTATGETADVFGTFVTARRCRPGMVTSEAQYAFIHTAVAESLIRTPPQPSQLPIGVADFLRRVDVPESLAEIAILIPGRKILAVGDFWWGKQENDLLAVKLILCSDVILICEVTPYKRYQLVIPPIQRDLASMVSVMSDWGYPTVDLKVSKLSLLSNVALPFCSLSYRLQAANQATKEEWIRLLLTNEGFCRTQLLSGAVIAPLRARTRRGAVGPYKARDPQDSTDKHNLITEWRRTPYALRPKTSSIPAHFLRRPTDLFGFDGTIAVPSSPSSHWGVGHGGVSGSKLFGDVSVHSSVLSGRDGSNPAATVTKAVFRRTQFSIHAPAAAATIQPAIFSSPQGKAPPRD